MPTSPSSLYDSLHSAGSNQFGFMSADRVGFSSTVDDSLFLTFQHGPQGLPVFKPYGDSWRGANGVADKFQGLPYLTLVLQALDQDDSLIWYGEWRRAEARADGIMLIRQWWPRLNNFVYYGCRPGRAEFSGKVYSDLLRDFEIPIFAIANRETLLDYDGGDPFPPDFNIPGNQGDPYESGYGYGGWGQGQFGYGQLHIWFG